MPNEVRMAGASPQCETVRQEMLTGGYTLLATPSFFDETSCQSRTSSLALPFHSKAWWKHPDLARYACWLEELLQQALPEEQVSLRSLEYRHERAGLINDEVDELHADRSYIRSVFSVYGPTTIYCDAGEERSTPEGQTLVMTAQDRSRARRVHSTLHRRPGAGPARAVIVCSFEPRGGQTDLANVYQEAARTLTDPLSLPQSAFTRARKHKPRFRQSREDRESRRRSRDWI